MLPGLKVHWRDALRLLAEVTEVRPDLLEVHLDAEDPTAHRDQVVGVFRPLSQRHLIALHQPMTLPDGRLLDLASDDDAHQRASVDHLHAVGDVALDVNATLVVLHPGGVRRPGEQDADPARLAEGLAALELPVPVVLENMPWWNHLPEGTTARSTLCRTPSELVAYEDLVAGFCLDVSHAWGARDPGSTEHVREFLHLGDRILHVHAADSAAPDREGLPFCAGGVTVEVMRDLAAAVGSRVACVPEVKGGEEAPELFEDALVWLRDAGCFTTAPEA